MELEGGTSPQIALESKKPCEPGTSAELEEGALSYWPPPEIRARNHPTCAFLSELQAESPENRTLSCVLMPKSYWLFSSEFSMQDTIPWHALWWVRMSILGLGPLILWSWESPNLSISSFLTQNWGPPASFIYNFMPLWLDFEGRRSHPIHSSPIPLNKPLILYRPHCFAATHFIFSYEFPIDCPEGKDRV